MRISIHASKVSLSRQDHAYVEYRMFSAISRLGLDHARLRIRLDDDHEAHAAAPYRCSVALQWAPAGRIRVRARAERLYRAVDAAAERLADGVDRRLDDEDPRGGDVVSPTLARSRLGALVPRRCATGQSFRAT
jgi:ribosome-associated translation inhibitor RaiA